MTNNEPTKLSSISDTTKTAFGPLAQLEGPLRRLSSVGESHGLISRRP